LPRRRSGSLKETTFRRSPSVTRRPGANGSPGRRSFPHAGFREPTLTPLMSFIRTRSPMPHRTKSLPMHGLIGAMPAISCSSSKRPAPVRTRLTLCGRLRQAFSATDSTRDLCKALSFDISAPELRSEPQSGAGDQRGPLRVSEDDVRPAAEYLPTTYRAIQATATMWLPSVAKRPKKVLAPYSERLGSIRRALK
jgi:hypothetical protein